MSVHPPTAELSQLFPRGCREKKHSVTPPKGRNYQILSGPFQRARDWKPSMLHTWLKSFLFYPYCLSVWSGAIFVKELTFTLQATKWSNIFQKQHTKSLRKIKIEFFFSIKIFCLKPVVPALEAAEPGSADLLTIPLSTSIYFATFPFSLTQHWSPSTHTRPLHCQYLGLFPCPAEGKHESTRSCG